MPGDPPGERAATTSLFRTWFWRPPRPHGETIADRRVSPLELLYDLVYVAVIAQAGNHLARHVSLSGLVEFTVIFALTYIAWTNGSLYLELHGRSDGRTRTFVFLQIGILAILAVFASDAGGGSGSAFALAYASYLVVMTWLWYDVRRQDVVAGHPEVLADAGRFVVAISLSAIVMFVTAFLPAQPRVALWAVVGAGWILLLLFLGRSRIGLSRGMTPTDSLVERFGLFTIIVLGEVVFGVVDGLSETPHDFKTISTGMVALVVGFGFWWIYFDVAGGRWPKPDGRALANWILSHFPITLSIAAAGAGMVSLLEHAHDATTPAATSWLLSGAVALGMVALILTLRALADAGPVGVVYRRVEIAMGAAAVISLIIGATRPAPWLLALLLVVVLALVWAVAARGFLRAGVWAAERPPG